MVAHARCPSRPSSRLTVRVLLRVHLIPLIGSPPVSSCIRHLSVEISPASCFLPKFAPTAPVRGPIAYGGHSDVMLAPRYVPSIRHAVVFVAGAAMKACTAARMVTLTIVVSSRINVLRKLSLS